jgi:hypothetical protein
MNDDLKERLQERSMELSRASFDSVDAGISANLVEETLARIEQLEAQRIDCIADLGVMEARAKLAEARLKTTRDALADIIAAVHHSQGGTQGAIRKCAVAAYTATTGAKTP